MVFRHKRTVCASASPLLLPFVSSELSNKTTILYLNYQSEKCLKFYHNDNILFNPLYPDEFPIQRIDTIHIG